MDSTEIHYKIILVEPNLSGHHKVYLEEFYKTLKSLGCNISVLSTKNILCSKKIKYIKPLKLSQNNIAKKSQVCINFIICVINLLSIRCKIKKNGRLIFFCCIDDYMNELMPMLLFNIIFPYKFSGLLLSPRKSKIYLGLNRLNILKSKYCSSIGVLDKFSYDYVEKYQKNVVGFPDFAIKTRPNNKYELSLAIKRKAGQRKIISLLGALDERKGYKTLIEASKILPRDKYFFVLAGKSFMSKDIENSIQKTFEENDNGIFDGTYIPSEEDFDQLVLISDVIFAAYINFSQSSNMFAKASLYKKPLIVSKGYYMEEVLSKYNLGESIEQRSAQECAKAIKNLCRVNTNVYGWEEYLKDNSIDCLKNSFEKILI